MINNKTEKIPEPRVEDKIVDIAIDLIDSNPESGNGDHPELSSAVFYVSANDLGDGKYPSLKVTVPKEEYSEKYGWRAELTFGNQDPALSTHILIRKDGTTAISDFTEGARDKTLDAERIVAIEKYLEDVKSTLIHDA